MIRLALLLLQLSVSTSSFSTAEEQRYRGDYTLGHEVNTFCPEIDSQCYWLNPQTDVRVRDRLKAIYQDKSPGLYQPVCVIVEGKVDRQTGRTGFAAEMDGLIRIVRIFGRCDSSETVTHGDLQHHRWILVKLDNRLVNQHDWPVLPSLDFGERLFVEGGDGCRRFNGFTRLTGAQIVFNKLEFSESRCDRGATTPGAFSITGRWLVRVRDSRYLTLQSSTSVAASAENGFVSENVRPRKSGANWSATIC
mgnify:CR=1 FL=1